MYPVEAFVRALPLSPAQKEELVGESLLKQHELYLRLPYFLAPLFPGVTRDQLAQLHTSSYLYFRFMLTLDGLLDGPAVHTGPGAEHATGNVLAQCNLFEQAIRGLGELFPAQDPFWPAFDRCKQQYIRANAQEKEWAAARRPLTREAFEHLAAGKSAVCYGLVHALSSLGRDAGPVDAVVRCLQQAHVAMQYADDEEDFCADWDLGQYTYAHSLVNEFLTQHHIATERRDGRAAHPYFYTSGAASHLLDRAQTLFLGAATNAQALGLGELAAYLSHRAQRCGVYRADIDVALQRARARHHARHLAAPGPADAVAGSRPTLADPARLWPFDATRAVIHAPDGRHLLINASAAALYRILAAAETPAQALAAFNAQFAEPLTAIGFEELVSRHFGGYQLVVGDVAPPRAPLREYLPVRLDVLPPAWAGALAAPLVPLYKPWAFWLTTGLLVLGLAAGYATGAPSGGPGGVGAWVVVPLVYGSLLVHELGHVAACLQAGVQPGAIGVGLYWYVFPVLYADVTGIWRATRRQRFVVNLAGIYAQFLYAAVLGTAAWITGHAPLHLAAVAVVFSALWQLNPFVRCDGYWLLSDAANTPNLMAQAKAALRTGVSARALRRVVASRGRVLWDRRSALFLYGAANASLLLGFLLLMALHHGRALLTFPVDFLALLKQLRAGALRPSDVRPAQWGVLAFYLFLVRYVALLVGGWFRRPAPSAPL